MVLTFVPTETEPDEKRVAATPESVRLLLKTGTQILVQAGAGLAAGFTDSEYTDAGASLESDAAAGYRNADIVLKVRAPRDDSDEVAVLREGGILICSLQPTLRLPLVQALARRRVTTLAMDLVPRITRAQTMDILSSQATAGGYHAVLLASVHLPRIWPLLMTAAGASAAAKVLVMGAGVAGLQAIAMARRLGGIVTATDVRPAVKEQVESLGAKFLDTGAQAEAETKGGYAKEASADFLARQREILKSHVAGSDVVITTAAVPGKKAPVLVTADMVAAMKPGSVVVDLAVETGGNVEGSVKGEIVEKDRVTIIGVTNIPGRVAYDASRFYARNLVNFCGLLVKKGELQANWEDEILKATMVTRDGQVTHAGAAQALSSQTTSGAS